MPIGYDAVTPGNLPGGGDVYFAYGNGIYANVNQVKAIAGDKPVYVIDVLNVGLFDILDIEKGDASPEGAGPWVGRRMGLTTLAKPCPYGSVSDWPAIAASVTGSGWHRSDIFVFTAHYTGEQHLCDESCGMPAGWTADLTQYADPGPFDEDYIGTNFLSPAVLAPPEDDDMIRINLISIMNYPGAPDSQSGAVALQYCGMFYRYISDASKLATIGSWLSSMGQHDYDNGALPIYDVDYADVQNLYGFQLLSQPFQVGFPNPAQDSLNTMQALLLAAIEQQSGGAVSLDASEQGALVAAITTAAATAFADALKAALPALKWSVTGEVTPEAS